MTAFLYARDLFRSEYLQDAVNLRLMFDSQNPTVEDEVVTQRLTEVLLRPMAFPDKQALEAKDLTDKAGHIHLSANAKKQLTRVVPVEKKGRTVQMH